jgi:hypothetical protein
MGGGPVASYYQLAFGLLDEPQLEHSGRHVGRAFMLKIWQVTPQSVLPFFDRDCVRHRQSKEKRSDRSRRLSSGPYFAANRGKALGPAASIRGKRSGRLRRDRERAIRLSMPDVRRLFLSR